jgi:hypothetical protein
MRIHTFDWPAHSPDLNEIERCWDYEKVYFFIHSSGSPLELCTGRAAPARHEAPRGRDCLDGARSSPWGPGQLVGTPANSSELDRPGAS